MPAAEYCFAPMHRENRVIWSPTILLLSERVPVIMLPAQSSGLRIAFGNLIGNALKYDLEGGNVRIRATGRDDYWEFGIWNDGAGIPRDKIKELFQKSHRLNTAGIPKRKGDGLGLFVTKKIVQLHGETIDVESEEGHWVEFSFVLPKIDGEAEGEE